MQTSATLELLIQRQLAENPNLRLKVIIEQLKNEELTLSHLKLLARLFFLSGEKQLFNDWLLEKLKSNQKFPVPWAQWLEFFKNVNLSTATKRAFIAGAERQGEFKNLARSRLLDEFEPELAKTYHDEKSKLQKKSATLKEKLLDELALFDSQNVESKKNEIKQKLKNQFSYDKDVANKIESLSEKDSFEKANLAASQALENIDWRMRPNFTQEEHSILQNWLSEIVQSSQASPENRQVDLIYFFKFLDAPELAIQLIDKLPIQNSLLLEIKAELLLEARRFIELLEFIDSTLPQLKSDSSIELLYIRSQALWNVGLKSEAIGLLESIAEVRPDYKLSQILLSEWKGDL